MRINLTAAILIAMFMQVSATGFAQRVSLHERNAPLKLLIQQIKAQTKVDFVYNPQMLKEAKNVSVDLQNVSMEEALASIFKDQPLSYTVDQNVVVIKRKERSIPPEPTKAKQQTVSGRVSDTNGEALPGATVQVKGSQVATSTNAQGQFSINAKAGDVLVFSMLGFTSQERTVSGTDAIEVRMEEESNLLKDVQIVSTGYRDMERKFFTGSVSTLQAEDVERSGVPDITRMLEGQAAGVSIQNVSGTFGAAPKIRVRGATSLSGDNKPLWVVDGIILDDVVNISNEALSTGDVNTLIGSSVAGLNPDDIASFTILKDAAATAMYGARAMNGVIVVTTKKGRDTDGKPLINYSGTFTTYLKPSYDQFDIMNSAEQMSILLEEENKYYFNHSSASRAMNGGIFYKMYNQMYAYDEATDSFTLQNTQQERLKFLERYAKANTDWFDLLFRNSLLQEHSLSVNTGSEKSQSYFSTSFTQDNGQSLGDNVKRYTANFRNNFQISDKLSAEVLVNGSIRDQQAPGTLTRKSDAVYGSYSRDFDINPYSYALNTSRLITPYDENGDLEYFTRNYANFNILNELENNFIKLNMLDLKVQGGLTYKILPSLTYSVNGAYRYAKTDRQHQIREQSNMVLTHQANFDNFINENNDFLYEDPDNPGYPAVVVLPDGGFYNTSLNSMTNYYFRQNLEYDAVFADKHSLNVYGSMETRYTNRQGNEYQGIGYQFDNGGLVNPNYRFFKKMIEAADPYFSIDPDYERYAAFMLRTAYAFDDRYSVNFTARYDGSNRLGSSRVARWLPTWNVSGKWNVDQEAFFPENKVLTALGLRATYGLTASMGSARNSTAIFYNQLARRPYEDEKEPLIDLSSLENKELTWEKMYEFNVGADMNLFDKVNLTVDYYNRRAFDLIGLIRTSGIGGQYTKYANYADMKAQGVEMTISGNPINNQDGLRWNTNFNFAINKNTITRLDVNQNIWTLVRAEGAAVNGYAQRGIFSIQFDGLNPNYGYPTFIDEEGEKNTVVDLQSDDIDFLRYHGPVDPIFTGGFYNNFSYKGFELSALFTFSQGNFIRLQPTYTADYDDMLAVSRDMVNRWLIPGDERYTNVPAILDLYVRNNDVLRADGVSTSAVYPYNAYNYSTERIAHGDFIRLKQLSLGYNLPTRLANKLFMRTAKVSLVGNNVALLYSDRRLNGADPEFFNNGGVAMPIPRQYTLSLKLGF